MKLASGRIVISKEDLVLALNWRYQVMRGDTKADIFACNKDNSQIYFDDIFINDAGEIEIDFHNKNKSTILSASDDLG